MAVHLLHTHAQGAHGGILTIDVVLRFGLQLDVVDLTLLDQAAGVGDEQTRDRLEVTLGALLLFLTNLAAISFGGILVFVGLGFRPLRSEQTWRNIPHSLLISAVLVVVLLIPLVVSTLQFVREAQQSNLIRLAVSEELSVVQDAQLVDLSFQNENDVLFLEVTIRAIRQPDHYQVVSLQSAVAGRLQRTVALRLIVIPTARLDPLIPPTFTPTATLGPSATPTRTPTASATPTSSVDSSSE